MQIKPAKEITHCRPDNIPADILQSAEPVILRGYGEGWPMVQAGIRSPHAAAEYLKKVHGGHTITMCLGNAGTQGRVFYNENMTGFNFEGSRVELGEFLDKILHYLDDDDAPTIYMPSTDIKHWFPGILNENPSGVEHLNPIPFLWMGNATRIAAHYDFPNNLACCVVGRRRFTLFPPDQISNLYPGPLEFAPGGQEISLVDFHNPDFQRFPKFHQALENAQQAELLPGDALFLPGMWWHHVDGLDKFNVLYTNWWREGPEYMGRPTNALLHAMLSLRSLPKQQRLAWKAIFEHYIFECDDEDIASVPEHAQGMLKRPIDEKTAMTLRAELIKKLKR